MNAIRLLLIYLNYLTLHQFRRALDVCVWLTETPAPSDFCFFVCYTNAHYTCLLIYYRVVPKKSKAAIEYRY